MPDLPSVISSGDAGHLAAHDALHAAFNGEARGPFALTHSTAGIDIGVPLFTPAVGDRILGIRAEFSQAWSVAGDELGLGVAATTDGDLRFKFPLPAALASLASFPCGLEFGVFDGGAIRVTVAAPLIARTVIGGNTTGALTLWVVTKPATQF